MIISIVFIIIYAFGIYFWNKNVSWRLNERAAGQIKYFHYALASLTILSLVLTIIDGTSFRGQWTTRIIIIGFLITGIFIFPLTNWTSKHKLEKYYFRVFSFLPILTAAFAMIPFLGIVIVLSAFGQLIDPVKQIYFEDNEFRVQSTFTGVLAPPRLDIIQKGRILEKRLNKPHRSAADIDSVSIRQGTDNKLVFLYYGNEIQDTLKIQYIR
jgi:hypothetical protein